MELFCLLLLVRVKQRLLVLINPIGVDIGGLATASKADDLVFSGVAVGVDKACIIDVVGDPQ